MVNERDSKKSLGKIVGISLVIGVGMGIFLKICGLSAAGWEYLSVFFRCIIFSSCAYVVPETIIVLWCFFLKRGSKEIWENKRDRFICLGSLISGYFITSLVFESLIYDIFLFDVIKYSLMRLFYILVSFFLIIHPFDIIEDPLMGLFVIPPIATFYSIAISIYATGGLTIRKRIPALILLSIFILWAGPLVPFPTA